MHTETICTLLAHQRQASNNDPSCIVLSWKHLKNLNAHHPISVPSTSSHQKSPLQSFIIIHLYMPSNNDDLTLLLNNKQYIVYRFIPHAHPPYGCQLQQRYFPHKYINLVKLCFLQALEVKGYYTIHPYIIHSHLGNTRYSP